MKVRAPIRTSYREQKPIFDSLKSRVDDMFASMCREKRWHYESRVKDELSYALKIETGRIVSLDEVEDFFGCTIVVRNSTEIGSAVQLVKTFCEIIRRRPPRREITFHRPSTFEFDDLRLYVKIIPSAGVPPRPEFDRIFEIQIKTFLFHAWAIATHDLMYKANDVNWGRERIAFQVRAMLEHAELTIEQAALLASSSSLGREDKETEELRSIISFILDQWPSDQLPNDLRRLSQNIRDLLKLVNVNGPRWKQLIQAEALLGPLPLDENPYQTTVRLLFLHESKAIQRYISDPSQKKRIVVYDTFERPEWFDPAKAHGILWVPT